MKSEKAMKVLYYEGEFDKHIGKFLNSVVKYKKDQIKGVLSKDPKDSLKEFLLKENIPLFTDIEQINDFDEFVITTLHFGKEEVNESRELLKKVLDNKKRIINGSHIFLSDEFKEYKDQIIDLRKNNSKRLFNGKLMDRRDQKRILTIGVDCNIGKMTTSLELYNHMKNSGYDVDFVPTGQIGMLIHGKGIPLDSSVVDFTSGMMEEHILEYDNKFLIVEGQGSIFTPLFSGLAIAQVHGSVPDYMVLCLDASRKNPRYFLNIPFPEIEKAIAVYEEAARLVNPRSKVIGISVNTSSLDVSSAENYMKEINEKTNLPVFDPVRKKEFDDILKVLNDEDSVTDVDQL